MSICSFTWCFSWCYYSQAPSVHDNITPRSTGGLWFQHLKFLKKYFILNFFAYACVGRWWWIICFLCPELQVCNIFFVGYMLQPLPPSMFLCPKLQAHNLFFRLLRVAPRPSFVSFVYRVPNVSCFFSITCCTSPLPLCFWCPQL
jgi:hypothetical protein